MRKLAVISSVNPLPYLNAMLNPLVGLGILLLIVSLLVRMALLSVADLSYVLPLTASGYVISSLLGWFFLQEQISPLHWVGIFLVFAGSSVVGVTEADTTKAT